MECQTAQSIDGILRIALQLTGEDRRRHVRPGVRVQYFFRGESRNYGSEADCYPSIELRPGLYRAPGLLKKESWFMNEAIRLFPDEFSHDKTTFERLTRLQHYGFPTRLADITQNVFVATAFACMGKDPIRNPRMGFVRVYRVNEDRIKYSTGDTVTALSKLSMLAEDKIDLKDLKGLAYEVKGERPGFYWRKGDPISLRLVEDIQKVWCVRPVINNSRINMQDGSFFLFGCGNRKKPLSATFSEDDFYQQKAATFGIAQIGVIGISARAKAAFSQAKQFLGVDDQRIYPDLEQLAKTLKKEVENG